MTGIRKRPWVFVGIAGILLITWLVARAVVINRWGEIPTYGACTSEMESVRTGQSWSRAVEHANKAMAIGAWVYGTGGARREPIVDYDDDHFAVTCLRFPYDYLEPREQIRRWFAQYALFISPGRTQYVIKREDKDVLSIEAYICPVANPSEAKCPTRRLP